MKRAMKACATVSVLVVLLAGSLAFAQTTPPQPVHGLTVWDSRGRMVGNVIGFGLNAGSHHPMVALTINGLLYIRA